MKNLSFFSTVDMSGIVSGLLEYVSSAFTGAAPVIAGILALDIGIKVVRNLIGEEYADDVVVGRDVPNHSEIDDDGVSHDYYDDYSYLAQDDDVDFSGFSVKDPEDMPFAEPTGDAGSDDSPFSVPDDDDDE